ncbi:DUF397 domain-containing protein [Streptomyces sp. AV19]|uniref:DUF397 domain-containing protein n=1 Tax=Streptomyces sp. AV19 TaxID=2793068 RepID=UPI0018FE6B23|nr:DUF397 domain-containing protein [Streptomyces sp. AV19]MBH1938410.1 DUF397 domain-containing protein [Streptomyces sp. AV19]MDG4535059.1 DUF397 domain-containing protein [Streptomyces sp. AV19]
MSNTQEPSRPEWAKSSHSSGQGGQCVEWAPARTMSGAIPIRDSKRPQGPNLTFPSASWHSFVIGIQRRK